MTTKKKNYRIQPDKNSNGTDCVIKWRKHGNSIYTVIILVSFVNDTNAF